MLNNLVNYEDSAELVELTYSFLQALISSKNEYLQEQHMKVLECSKMLLAIGVKHTAVYKSDKSYDVIMAIVERSQKFKNKKEIENVRIYF